MRNILTILGAVVAIPAIIILLSVLGAALGAFGGLVVGWFFDDSIRATLANFGINLDVQLWQLGATLGYFGGFISGIVQQTNTNNG